MNEKKPKGGKENTVELFKKIEKWIGSKDENLKCILVLFWILWAIIRIDYALLDNTKRPQHDFEADRAVAREMITFYNRVEMEADRKGVKYGPKDYFADFKRIEAERERIKKQHPDLRLTCIDGYGVGTPFFKLQGIMNENRIRGKFSWEEIDREARNFNEWKRGGGATGEELRKKFHGFSFGKKIKIVFDYLLIFYLRSLIMVFFWYLLQMCTRRGILETILADKKKFLLAIVGWPIFIWKYPHNKLREIRVEAELRRLGNVFRRFGVRDKLLIQKIASSEQYEQWLDSFRHQNSSKFQSGIFLALVVTLVFVFVAPVFCHDLEYSGTDPPTKVQISISIDYHHVIYTFGDRGMHEAIPQQYTEKISRIVGRFIQVARMIKSQGFVRLIEHVPLSVFQVLDYSIIPLT